MIAVSSICSGISPERAVEFVEELRGRLGGARIGLELMPTTKTLAEAFRAYAMDHGVHIYSLHGPFLFRSGRSWAERAEVTFWQRHQGRVYSDSDGTLRLNNPAFKMSDYWGCPVIVHGPAALGLVDGKRLVGKASVRVENGKETLPDIVGGDFTPLKLAVRSAMQLKEVGVNVEGICLDIGHLAVDAVKHGWSGEPREFMEQFVRPAEYLASKSDLGITELHLHDFDVKRCRDHLELGTGRVPFEPILEHFLSRNPDLQLTLEIVPSAAQYLALSYAHWGYEEILRRVEASIRYLRCLGAPT